MRASGGIGFALLMTGAVTACGQTTARNGGKRAGSSSGSSAPVARDQLAPQAAQVLCESFATCCQRQALAVDERTCLTVVTQQLEGELEDEQSAGSVFDAAKAGTCLDALRAGARCGLSDKDARAACEEVFVGTRAAGEACTQDEDCLKPLDGQAYCDRGFNPELDPEGVCVVQPAMPFPRGELGDACFASCASSACAPTLGAGGPSTSTIVGCYREDGLYCASNNTCSPLEPTGFACRSSEDCGLGTVCDRVLSLCIEPKPNGAACRGDDECLGRNCADNGLEPGHCAELSVASEQCGTNVPF